MGWIAVSFYTAGTGYENEVKKLKASAEALGIPLAIYPTAPAGSWRRNLDEKSATILRAMIQHPGDDIAFVDADAIFRAYPTLFDMLSECRAYDLAVHYLLRPNKGAELLSGTVWVANTDQGRMIIQAWDKFAREHPHIRHQQCLDLVLRQLHWPRIYRLPAEYTRIFDNPWQREVKPIIEHFQASRRLRNKVGGIRPPGPGPFAIRRAT